MRISLLIWSSEEYGSERLAEYGWKPHRKFVAQQTHITGLNLLGYAWKAGGYRFIEFEISNNTNYFKSILPTSQAVNTNFEFRRTGVHIC